MKDNLQLELLQLQKSALIDTQTIMQILITKGICTVGDILSTRDEIQNESEDVKRINQQIVELDPSVAVSATSTLNKSADPVSNNLINELRGLLTELTQVESPTNISRSSN